MNLTRKQAKPLIERTFPEYRGRKITLLFQESLVLSNTNWSGGTKSWYAAVHLDGRTASINTDLTPPWDNPIEGQRVNVPLNVIIVQHRHFCGTDLGLTIYVNPANKDIFDRSLINEARKLLTA